jgi:hypothetical protein
MVNEAYDHIVAIVIVGMIFIGTVVALPAIAFSNLQTVDEQQLRNTALNVFEAMLLSVGSPSDWGSTSVDETFDKTKINTFGLARSNPLSKFVLDVDKVQRIDPGNPTGIIQYDDIRHLLNIEDYGFKFTILRPFEVDWSLDIMNNAVYYSVNVTRTEDKTPIPNAVVTVTTTLGISSSSDPKKAAQYDIVKLEPVIKTTDVMGRCSGSQTGPGETITHALSIMTITVAGMSTTVVAHTESPFIGVIKLTTSGDTLTISLPEEVIGNDTHSERIIHNIDAYFSEGSLLSLYDDEVDGVPPNDHVTHGSGYEFWTFTYPGLRDMDPTALVFWVETTLKGYGRVLIAVAGTMDFGDSSEIISIGPESTSERVIAVMRRLVVISGMTYVTAITFWKE